MNDYDERGAIARMAASEAGKAPPALVLSDASGKRFYGWCHVHAARISPESLKREPIEALVEAHNAQHALDAHNAKVR